ncbi:hypothetical protein [Rhodococcus wratislaviensis]|uniref:hypothetical protein n=1 Tax=Rhodococcus wratislaviensis TaxID=44752 RepID=UPI0035165A4F
MSTFQLVVPAETGKVSLQGDFSHTEQLLPGDGVAADGGDADGEELLLHASWLMLQVKPS